ncbi:hypothetical protein [Halocynthiibacter styelae]|uniref:Macro domain-containing protein n=1 Tax=Halocynthiibacter styelae TaxID=2761955 RepID=A0A8J7LPS9_9RHOB|nr:hypothetical protein [Paenihalocynthiibacter styelae]MBI1494066.1 hypothetical protein [Paenihalocynthiibacter styelae]
MSWFEDLAGVSEGDEGAVRAAFDVEGHTLVSQTTGRRMQAGQLTVPSLNELRQSPPPSRGKNKLCEMVADVTALHVDPENAGAVFQVASQFNLLEMIGPSVSPADGITGYEYDRTQGPACAIACGAGTIWRNYFTTLSGDLGQCRKQIDSLADMGRALGNESGAIWRMQNGYVLPGEKALAQLRGRILRMNEAGRDEIRSLLRIGLQQNTEVTVAGGGSLVSQVYASALPVAYSNLPEWDWEPFARLVLEAAYEATLRIAAQNASEGTSDKLFLTLLGGGAFGNRTEWITDAIDYALRRVNDAGLDVTIVSYGQSQPALARLLSVYS